MIRNVVKDEKEADDDDEDEEEEAVSSNALYLVTEDIRVRIDQQGYLVNLPN